MAIGMLCSQVLLFIWEWGIFEVRGHKPIPCLQLSYIGKLS